MSSGGLGNPDFVARSERDVQPHEDERRRPETLDEELLEAEVPGVATLETDATRVERMRRELAMGFELMKGVDRGVSIFGSARTPREDPEYELASETARVLGRAGYAIITGGGPGIMEAANRGAQDVDALSIGLEIDLPFEQGMNDFIDRHVRFHYFFTRKIMFVRYARSFVVFPGGFGTLDELFESLTLIQTGKVIHFPVVLVGSDYWSGLLEWMRERMLAEGKISPRDMELINLCDDPQAVLRLVEEGTA